MGEKGNECVTATNYCLQAAVLFAQSSVTVTVTTAHTYKYILYIHAAGGSRRNRHLLCRGEEERPRFVREKRVLRLLYILYPSSGGGVVFN